VVAGVPIAVVIFVYLFLRDVCGVVFVEDVGLLVPLLVGRTSADRWRAYVAVLPALVLGAVGYVVFLWLDTLRPSV
jgi:hypothetical protein